MPKEITHWLIAKEAFSALTDDSPVKIAVHQAPNLYYCAAVIPDTPYYYLGRKGREIKLAADIFHRRLTNSFWPFLRILKGPTLLPFAEELSFIAGITSHIMADSTFHPSIDALIAINDGHTSHDPTAVHRQLETALDLFFLDDEKQTANSLLLKNYFADLEIETSLFCRLLKVFFDLPSKTNLSQIDKAIKHHCFCQAIFKHPVLPGVLNCVNTALFHRLDRLLALFYRYPKNSPTNSPPFLGESQALIALKEVAVQRTVEALTFIEKCSSREKLADFFRIHNGPNLVTGQPQQ